MPDKKKVEEINEAIEAAEAMFKALSKGKQRDMLGHWNAVALVLEAAKREASK